MPATKFKASRSNHRKGSTSGKPVPSSVVSRKKRRIISDDEEDEYHSEPPESEEGEGYPAQGTSGRTRQRHKMNQSQVSDAGKLFESDTNMNTISIDSPPHDIPDRAPTPIAAPSRKRSTRKRSVPVFSDDDDDDEYVDSGRKQDNKDDDFVVDDAPPPKKTTGKKGGAGAGRGRGKAKEKEKGGGIGEIHIKDERKLPPRRAPAAAATGGDTKAGAKRRRETVSEPKAEGSSNAEATTTGAPSSTTAALAKQAPEGTPTGLPPSKVRKLPPIKKNKNLAGATSTAPPSGPTTPSGPSTTGTKTGTTTAAGLPIHTSLPRKPIPKTSDVDLSSPDIYNSLFKTGSAAPRVGVNSRLKEEERRKELMKMRDEARAARMANLQKGSFNLLAAQDKISRFEEKLRERNSPALYPNHLAPALKIISMQRNAGVFQRRPGGNVGNINGSSNAGTGDRVS